MGTSLKRYAPIAAIIGGLGLLAAIAIYLLQRQLNVAVQASLVVGLLGLAVAILLDPGTLQSWAGRRQARYGGNVLLMSVALLGILVVVNYLATKNTQQWDLTANKVNTLAPETQQTLQNMSAPVKAIGFYLASSSGAQTTAKNLFEQFRVASGGKFTYEFHDPNTDPTLARQYKIIADATTVLVMGDHQETIATASEDQIDGALVRLSHPAKRTVFFVTGHGEAAIDGTDPNGLSTVISLMKNQNYDIQTLNLAVTTTVPVSATAVVIAGPKVPLTADETGRLADYLQKGGAVVVMQDPLIETQLPFSTTEPLVNYLATSWGVKFENDVVVDLNNSYQSQGQAVPFYPLSKSYGSSAIVSKLQSIQTVFPVARSVTIPKPGSDVSSTTYSELVKLDPGAWGETNMASFSQTSSGPSLDAADVQPTLAVAVSAQNSVTKARLVAIGDSTFATNQWSNAGADANLLMNSIDWATSDETLINVTPRTPTQMTLSLTNALTINAIFVLVVIVMPLLVLILGGVVWFQRRRHI